MIEKEFYVERTIEGEEHELTLKITFDIEPFHEGRRFGPPELCCPDEGGTADVKEILLVKEDGEEKWDGELTSKEEREFCQEAYNSWAEKERERLGEEAIDRYESRFDEDMAMSIMGKGDVYW